MINKFKQVLSKIGKCLGYGLLLGAIALIAYVGYSMAAFFFHLDLSQSYRNIDGYEGITFEKSARDGRMLVYKRTFAGLRESGEKKSSNSQGKENDEVVYLTLKERLGEGAKVIDYAASPDNKYILYVVTEDVSKGASTDTERYYYKVLDLQDNSSTTIYKGYLHDFAVEWQ